MMVERDSEDNVVFYATFLRLDGDACDHSSVLCDRIRKVTAHTWLGTLQRMQHAECAGANTQCEHV